MNLNYVMCLALLSPPYCVAHLLRETALMVFDERTFADWIENDTVQTTFLSTILDLNICAYKI
jgi:hypothetical protein